MKALVLSLTLLFFALSPLIAAPSALADDGTGASADSAQPAKKKKKKGKKKKKKAAEETGDASAQPLAIDTSLPPQAAPASAAPDPDDMGIMPMDVSNMIFDPKAIQDVIRHHMPQVQACYERVLAESGKAIEGKVVVAFTIDVTGSVYEAKALKKKGTMKDDRIIECVVNRVRRLVFPKPPDNRRYPIEFPFNLTVKK